jgi:hypothetical protein
LFSVDILPLSTDTQFPFASSAPVLPIFDSFAAQLAGRATMLPLANLSDLQHYVVSRNTSAFFGGAAGAIFSPATTLLYNDTALNGAALPLLVNMYYTGTRARDACHTSEVCCSSVTSAQSQRQHCHRVAAV